MNLNSKGYTLIELLAVFVILGVLMAVTIPNIVGITEANKLQTYAEDAKKFKNTVEYRFRGDSTIEKPQNNGECIIANLKYVAGSEYDNPPYGGQYMMDQSYVIMVKDAKQYKYYVQLVEDLDGDEGYRGVGLKDATLLDGEKYQDEIDEATNLSSTSSPFGPSLSAIAGASTEAEVTTVLTNLAPQIKGKKITSPDNTLEQICTTIKTIYYEA